MGPQFTLESRIMAFHGPLLYEGKIVKYEDKTDKMDDQHWYQIHYLGWSKKWDEWVPEKHVIEYSEESCKRQAELYNKYQEEKAAEKAKREKQATTATQSKVTTSKVPMRKKRPLGNDIDERSDIQLPLGNQLRKQLVDDWEAVTRNKKLIKLPHQVSVSQILEEFLASRNKRGAHQTASSDKMWQEITEGLRAYFDAALGQILLYRFERQQYNETLKQFPTKRASDIYGCEHFLRLFVKLPQLLLQADVDPDALQLLQAKVTDFLKHIQKNCDRYVSDSHYELATDSYIKAWKQVEAT